MSDEQPAITSTFGEQPDIPLYGADYLLKRMDTNSFTPLQKLAFELAFPGFRGIEEPTERQREVMEKAVQEGRSITWQQTPARRYAGDHMLPPGRYYTLVRNKSGDDGNTLLMELMGYHNPSASGPVTAVDLGTPEMTERMTGQTGKAFHIIAVSFLSWPDQRSPLWEAAEKAGLLSEVQALDQHPDPVSGETYVPVLLPYELVTVPIRGVVDLRYPLCQDWFVKTFSASPLERQFANDPEYTVFQSFAEMLPSMLTPTPGGSMFEGKSQYIGHWLRTHGVAALVFPSARANAAVHFVDGELVDFRGWNLVDYRDASPPVGVTVDVSFFGAPTALPEGVRIVLPPPNEPGMRGSFIVQGLSEWHMKRLNRPGATGVLDLV